ncbi:MAG: transcription antitermination factor NusB [Microcoleaceae cyanobacterium]
MKRKSPRKISRELALLGLSQLPSNVEKVQKQSLPDLLLAAVRSLTAEVHDTLETAAAEIQRGNERLLSSQITAPDLESARAMVYEAIALSETAINRLGTAMEIPELIQLANQHDVKNYALEIIVNVNTHKAEIDNLINESMVDWQVERLPRVDRDILRLAAAEIMYLELPEQIAINESVELAKRYSGDEGYRFINGVLRRFVEVLHKQNASVPK